MPDSHVNKYAMFDFCETIANFQTADAYVEFVILKSNRRKLRTESFALRAFRKLKLFRLMEKIKGNPNLYKKWNLRILKGMPKDTLEKYAMDFYKSKIQTSYIRPILDKLLELKSEGYKVYIVSGGYDIYLKYFVKEYNLDGLVCNELNFKDGLFAGNLKSTKECMYENKVSLLNRIFKIKPNYSIGFSDSSTDVPLLNWCTTGIVVSKYRHQEWVNDYKFEEIIWK